MPNTANITKRLYNITSQIIWSVQHGYLDEISLQQRDDVAQLALEMAVCGDTSISWVRANLGLFQAAIVWLTPATHLWPAIHM